MVADVLHAPRPRRGPVGCDGWREVANAWGVAGAKRQKTRKGRGAAGKAAPQELLPSVTNTRIAKAAPALPPGPGRRLADGAGGRASMAVLTLRRDMPSR